MKNNTEKYIVLPESIKNQIYEDITHLKILLKDEKEFADQTVKKILNLSNSIVKLESIDQHLSERYTAIKNVINEEGNSKVIADNFFNFRIVVNNLARLIKADHELTDHALTDQYIKIYSDINEKRGLDEQSNNAHILRVTSESLNEYKNMLPNQIAIEIQDVYQQPLDIVEIIGNSTGNI